MDNMQIVNAQDIIQVTRLQYLLAKLIKEPELLEETILDMINLVPSINNNIIQQQLPGVFNGVTKAFTCCAKNTSADQRRKCLITDLLKIVFDKIKINSLGTFFEFYIFLLNHIYDNRQPNLVANIYEEYKLSIMTAVISLLHSLTYEAKRILYTRENGFHLCEMLHIALSLAQNERLRSLRLASIECIMSLAQINDNQPNQDDQFRQQVADIFMFFAPGVISGLGSIAREDEKCAHKIILLAVQAWGRIIALQMENYNNLVLGSANFEQSLPPQISPNPYKSKEDAINHLKNSKLDARWYRLSDEKLRQKFAEFTKLTWHSHPKVRLELAQSCILIVEHCADTIPNSVSKAVEILIKLSEDEDDDVANTSKLGLHKFQANLSGAALKDLLENLEEDFFASLTSIPRIFNSYDEIEQLSSLNLLVGYLRLFGPNLEQVLRSVSHSQRLLETFIHISEFERTHVRLFEEYAIQDLELVPNPQTPWKNFRYFNSGTVQKKIEDACHAIGEFDSTEQMTDLLLNIFLNSEENRREVTFILNNIISGIPDHKVYEHMKLLHSVINLYIDPEYWKLPTEVSYKCLMSQVQYNIIQICLQVEGISKIALKLQEGFRPFLLKTLSPMLEKAGSTNSLIKLAGASAIANISKACGYPNVSSLINENCDYFGFHVINKIQKSEENLGVLNILTTVVRYSDITILPTITNIISDVLMLTYDKYFREDNITSYLHLFKIFIESLLRWLAIEVVTLPIKSKQQLIDEYEQFQISSLNLHARDDHFNGRTAEEMYKEDLEKYKNERDMMDEQTELSELVDNEERPHYIKLTVELLKRALNFLPSKDKSRKLLVIDILIDGLEVIRDWENDLLPLVHKIWGPLVERFKEKNESLIINRSFQLLVTLARLSKDFIRSRTVKDVLPHVLTVLNDLVDHSYLKDHGAAYRYTQAYKLQLNILQQLSRIIIDIDMTDKDIERTMERVVNYLSDKQPIPLQKAAIGFYIDLIIYDKAFVTTILERLLKQKELGLIVKEYEKNMEFILKQSPRCN